MAFVCFSAATVALADEFTITNQFGNVFSFTPMDIGTPGADPAFPGSTTNPDFNSFQIKAGGSDIGGTNDAFHFVYTTFSGDFDIRARIPNFTAPNSLAKAGLIVRETTNADSSTSYCMVTPTNAQSACISGYRAETGAELQVLSSSHSPVTFPNVWLRITRMGTAFQTYRSTNGIDWQVESSFSATALGGNSPQLLVGLGLVAHDNVQDHFAECDFTSFSLNAFSICTCAPTLSWALVNEKLVLSWDALTGSGYHLTESEDLIHWSSVATAIETTYGTCTATLSPVRTTFYQLEINDSTTYVKKLNTD